jgi:hypothetical protein
MGAFFVLSELYFISFVTLQVSMAFDKINNT